MTECRKCSYFKKKRPSVFKNGNLIVGFCALRQKEITDESIRKPLCKDRAIL